MVAQGVLEIFAGRQETPDFLEQVSGLGAAEGWGCWGSESRIHFRFRDFLPFCFEVDFRGAVVPANIGRVITVTAGSCRRALVIANTIREPMTPARIHFHLPAPSRSLEFWVPDAQPEGPGSARRLGLALGYIAILPAGPRGIRAVAGRTGAA